MSGRIDGIMETALLVDDLDRAGALVGDARSIHFRDPAGNSLECAEPGPWNLK